MLFARYDFTCRLETDSQLPPYKGSTFRGVFGRALKKVTCALKQQECTTCLLNKNCVYVQIFETPVSSNSNNFRMASPPHPFVIEPPMTTESYFPAGTCFDFSLLLMGEANNFIPYFIYAFEQMGKIGIGRKIKGQRGRFLLENVKRDGEIIYSSHNQKLVMTSPVEKLELKSQKQSFERHSSDKQSFDKQSFDKQPPDQNIRLKLTLETPLRLKFANKLQADLPFHLLVRAMLRRVSALLNVYGKGEPLLDYPGLVKKAQTIQTADKNLAWFDWQRYSFRQDKKMLMGGITGSVTYEGKIGEYLPLIDFCEQVHLGKQTTFGLGKIKADILP